MYSTTVSSANIETPPDFFRMAAEPIRWGLLRALARSDRRVEELSGAVDRPQNLVSYHLARLKEAGLVAARRSSRDGRDVYYRLNVGRCSELLAEAGGLLHPAMLTADARAAPRRGEPGRRNVLFLCTGNSARSQMAEALLTRAGGGTFHAASAGSRPSSVHPQAIATMRERGIDISGQRSKHMSEFDGVRVDVVVTVCDLVREECPQFDGAGDVIHWSVPDPSEVPAGDAPAAFGRVAEEIEERVRLLVAQLRQG